MPRIQNSRKYGIRYASNCHTFLDGDRANPTKIMPALMIKNSLKTVLNRRKSTIRIKIIGKKYAIRKPNLYLFSSPPSKFPTIRFSFGFLFLLFVFAPLRA